MGQRRAQVRFRNPRRLSLAGALVVQARLASGLSQREVARRSGVSRTTVAEIELGARDPGLETLRSVLHATGHDVDLRLVRHDDHDEVLDRVLDRLGESERARLQQGFTHFVEGLAAGLAASRPLAGSDD
jgi:transcriptional regulator with XRE-family HTH domain